MSAGDEPGAREASPELRQQERNIGDSERMNCNAHNIVVAAICRERIWACRLSHVDAERGESILQKGSQVAQRWRWEYSLFRRVQ